MWKETFPLEEDFSRRAGGATQTQYIQDSSTRGQYRKPNENFHLSAERTRELSYSCGDLPLILENYPFRAYRSRNEDFDHSAERTRALSSSSANILDSPLRKSRYDHSGERNRRFSSSCGDVPLILESHPRRAYRSRNEDVDHSAERTRTFSSSSSNIFARPESPAFRPYRSQNENFDNSARIIRAFSSSSENIFARPESPSSRSYRSRNEEFYHSAERITGLSSSSGNTLVESPVRRKSSLPYRTTKEHFYHTRVAAKRLSVSSGDIGLRPESPSRRSSRSRNEKFYRSAERITGLSSSSGNILVESPVRRNRSLPYRTTHDYFYHPTVGAKRLSVSSGDIGLRPESPSRRSSRSRNEKFYRSAERITGLSSSSGNILVESPVRRKRSLPYRTPKVHFYHPRVGAKRLSVSSGDIGLRPVDKKTNEDVAESGGVFFKDPYLDCSVEEEVHKEFESNVSIMVSTNLEDKTNITRLSRLLVEKGTEALRNTFDSINPPAGLPAVLNANKISLLRLKCKIINDAHWDLLFPPSGNPPDSKTFDSILLNILLWNICGLPSPAAGWNTMPLAMDRSPQANITRIRLLRNEVYAHVSSIRVDKAIFENIWVKISQALVDLKIPQKEVDDLKTCRFGPEDEIYVDRLKDWFLRAEQYNKMLVDVHVEQSVKRLPQVTELKHTLGKGKGGNSRSKIKANVFFASFVCGHLAKHTEAQHLVTLKEDSQRSIVLFNDINKINSIYCDFKKENSGILTGILNGIFNRKSKKRKDKFKNLLALLEKEKLLEIVGSGTEYDKEMKEYLKYEVKNGQLWYSLTQNYKIGQSGEPFSDARDRPQSWKWQQSSKVHRQKFVKLVDYGREHPEEIKEINGVRVCFADEFCIGRGSDGTRVYVGLGNDGVERAVKRMHRDACSCLAEHEKQVLSEHNTSKSNYVVNYWFLDEKRDIEYLFLILDLCEETLEDFVDRSSLEYVVTIAPDIIKQVLKGLADLHRGSMPILHRDLKPNNILRNVQGNWLLADFGISRIMTEDPSTIRTNPKGTKDWRAVETYHPEGRSADGKVRYKKETDVQVAGMVAFYIVTKGAHPFGAEADRLRNLLDDNAVDLDMVKDTAAKDLISWMLSHRPKDRPSAEEALKHPYLQPKGQQFEMLCTVGNEFEIKTRNAMSDVVRKLNSNPKDWRSLMRADVLEYLATDSLTGRKINYTSSWADCLRLMRNVKQHWNDRPRPRPEVFYLVGDPQEYFLNLFPNLPVEVHRIVRTCNWRERTELRKFFGKGFPKADAMYAQKRPPKKEPSLVKERGFPKADPMHAQKRPPKKEPSLVGKRGCVTADDMHAQTILPMQGSSLVEKRVDVKKKENNSKDGNTFFEDIFLDSEYSIREEVHEKFKRFSWLSGAYGLKGPNDKITRPHLYVTVKRGKKKSEVLKEIKEMFECDPKKYFELFREPKRKPKFKYSSKPTSGGGIVAVSKDKDNNPLKVLDQSVDEGSSVIRASGTLTMFCSQNDNHYALTCFHVGCATDEQCFHQTFKHQELVDIQKSMEGYKRYAREQQEYYYKDQDNESTDENYNPITPANYIHLGEFSKCCFHSESDIMSIQVREDIEIHCRVAEIDFPDWKKIWKELYDRVVCNGGSEDHVTVQKHGYTTNLKHTGRIVECNFSYKCQDRVLFQNAIVVKGNSQTFLKDGDSGALICFLDKTNEKQAFAYGVCEVDQLQPEEMSSDEDSDNSSQPSTSSEDSSEKDFTFLDDEGVSASIGTSSEGCGAGATRCVRKDEDEDNSDEQVISAKTSDEVSGAAAMVGEAKDENDECSDDDFIIFQDEGPFAICLKLNTALENLGLSNAGCFKECGGRK